MWNWRDYQKEDNVLLQNNLQIDNNDDELKPNRA